MRARIFCVGSVSILAGASSCSLDQANAFETYSSVNRCEADSDCPGARCEGAICRSTGTLETVLIEVTPPIVSQGGARLTFLQTEQLIRSGSAKDIDVGSAVRIRGSVVAAQGKADGCVFVDADGDRAQVGAGGTLPAHVTFRPVKRLPGLFAPDYEVLSTSEGRDSPARFEVMVPPGQYDVHVVPFAQAEKVESCQVVPVVYRAREFPEGQLSLTLHLPAPRTLAFSVSWPSAFARAPKGYRADVLHPETGMVLSEPFVLPEATRASETEDWQSEATLLYSPAEKSLSRGFVRLLPPSETDEQESTELHAPKIVVALETLGIFGEKGSIRHFSALPDFSTIEGSVTDENAAPVPRTLVAFTALDLVSVVDTWAAYTKYVETDAEGHFSTKVFAGDYRMFVTPPTGRDLSPELRSRIDLSIGRLVDVELLATNRLAGSVITPQGVRFIGASIHAVPMPLSSTPVDQALARLPVTPNAANAEILEGRFENFRLEPGAYHLSVRPAEGSGFPWVELPGFEPPRGGADPSRELDTFRVPYPVIYQGRIMSGGVPLGGALIRAYAYLQDGQMSDAESATTVVQVAETRAERGGEFRLLLPPDLAPLGGQK